MSSKDIFTLAFMYLRKEYGIKSQRELANTIGVSEDTISRVKKGYCDMSDDMIAKIQKLTNDAFNYLWLKGKEEEPMLAKDRNMIQNVEKKAEPEGSMNIVGMTQLLNDYNQKFYEQNRHIAELQKSIIELQKDIKHIMSNRGYHARQDNPQFSIDDTE